MGELDLVGVRKINHKIHTLTRCILFLVGIVYLISLPRRDLSHKAFFDENALLAGVVRREFADPNTVAQYASEVERLSSNE